MASVAPATPSGHGAGMRPARPFSSQVKRSKEVDFTEAAVHAREQAKKKSKTPAATRASLQQVRRSLPVFEYRETLLNAARTNKNLIVVGETGSGKTTQIPQYLYESGFAKGGMIAVTQPRRVAAITVAQRVAEEMGVELGSLVGYTIRFDDVSSDETKIKYLTDGMLLREIQIDPRLSRYSVIMLDEAHERTLNTDILFALLKRLQATDRPDLRVIAMSATLDAAKFSSYFYGAPVALVPGRTHKVDISYTEEPVTDVVEACVTTAMGLHIDRPLGGDILVFMAGSDDIDAAKQVMEERARLLPAGTPGLIVYPLYSTLSPEQQLKAFEPTPPGLRKVVFATNIAETSITLAGIRFVIDTGVAKVKQFVPSTSVEWLAAHPISKAEAFQRSGRSGREAPGECFRLMTEDAFLDLATSVVPEILRCSMASAVLALKSIGVDDVLGFDFIDKPERRALKQALVDLIALGALDSEDMRITRLGRLMSEFPLEPHYAKVLISSADPSTAVDEKSDKYAEYQRRRAQADVAREKARAKGRSAPAEDEIAPDLPFEACSFEMATLLAAVSADQILTTVPKTKVDLVHKQEAARRRFATPDGDLMMLLDILTQFGGLPENRREQWCKENFVNHRNAKMALKVRAQLVESLERLSLPVVSCIATANSRAAQEQAAAAAATAPGATAPIAGLGDAPGSTGDSLFGAAFSRLAQLQGSEAAQTGAHESSALSRSIRALGFTSPGSISSALLSQQKPLDNLKKCLITGLFDKVAIRLTDGSYQTVVDSQNVSIHPSSIIIQYAQSYRAQAQATQANAYSRVHAPIAAGDGARPQGVGISAAARTPGNFGVTGGHASRGGPSSSGAASGGGGSGGGSDHPLGCVIFHELVMTTKKFVRDLMTIEQAWLTEVAPSYFENLRAHRSAGGSAAAGEPGYDRDYDSSQSHVGLMPGQKSAFASLTSKVLPMTTSLSVGKATLPRTPAHGGQKQQQEHRGKAGAARLTPAKHFGGSGNQERPSNAAPKSPAHGFAPKSPGGGSSSAPTLTPKAKKPWQTPGGKGKSPFGLPPASVAKGAAVNPISMSSGADTSGW